VCEAAAARHALDYGKITPEQAYTLGIASLGLVPDVSYLPFPPNFSSLGFGLGFGSFR
jgi:hypothetical protein